MHGPDGTDYQEWICWTEIVPPERIAMLHGESRGDPNAFESVITFAPDGTATRIEMRTVFPTKQVRDEAVEKYHAIEGGRQTLNNLAAYVSRDRSKGELRTDPVCGSGLFGRTRQQAVLAVVADLEQVVEQVEHVDEADEERQLDQLRVAEMLLQLDAPATSGMSFESVMAARVYSIASRSRGASPVGSAMTSSGSSTMSEMSTRSQCEFVQNWQSFVCEAVMITSSLTRRSSRPPG